MSHPRLLSCFALLLWGLLACSPTRAVGRVDLAPRAPATQAASELREITERLAREVSLGMSGYLGEVTHDPQYAAPPSAKLDSLLVAVNRLEPGLDLVVTHVELGALCDMNSSFPLPETSKRRQAELDALTAQRSSGARGA